MYAHVYGTPAADRNSLPGGRRSGGRGVPFLRQRRSVQGGVPVGSSRCQYCPRHSTAPDRRVRYLRHLLRQEEFHQGREYSGRTHAQSTPDIATPLPGA